jgi:hypothetical protein
MEVNLWLPHDAELKVLKVLLIEKLVCNLRSTFDQILIMTNFEETQEMEFQKSRGISRSFDPE